MAKRTTEKTIRVGDMDIIMGNRYIITSRPDNGNPFYKKYNTTKNLIAGVSEWRQAPWNNDTNVFDTGFEEFDRVNITSNTSKEEVLKYQTYIKEPFEARFRVELSGANEDFWLKDEKSMVEVKKDKEFNTKNVRDLFELFLILKHGWAVSKTDMTSRANGVAYYVESISAKSDNKNKIALTKGDAYENFFKLFADVSKNDKLYTILEWMGTKDSRKLKVEDLKPYLQTQLESYDFCEKFLATIELYDNPRNKEEMEFFSALTKLRGEQKVTIKDRKFYIGNTMIGNTLKEGAKLATNSESEKGMEIREAIQNNLD